VSSSKFEDETAVKFDHGSLFPRFNVASPAPGFALPFSGEVGIDDLSRHLGGGGTSVAGMLQMTATPISDSIGTKQQRGHDLEVSRYALCLPGFGSWGSPMTWGPRFPATSASFRFRHTLPAPSFTTPHRLIEVWMVFGPKRQGASFSGSSIPFTDYVCRKIQAVL